MKKLILKTALITLGGAILLLAVILLILSFAAPKAMMKFTSSLGMEQVSGNFAYSEYERSGDLECLARSFLIASEKDDETAIKRWEALYADENFSIYCETEAPDDEVLPEYSYRDYLTGTAARVKYRLATTAEEKRAVLDFALSETGQNFPAGNPIIALSLEAVKKGDGDFLAVLRAALETSEFEKNNDFLRLLAALTPSD